MGLGTSHNAWHGGYSSFHQWRVAVALAADIDLEKMEGFTLNGKQWSNLSPRPLHILLDHSDCDGQIAWQDCGAIAQELEKLLPFIADHWREKTKTFIAGLTLAHDQREDLLFR